MRPSSGVREGGGGGRGQREEMVAERDLTESHGRTRQCAADALLNVHLTPMWFY